MTAEAADIRALLTAALELCTEPDTAGIAEAVRMALHRTTQMHMARQRAVDRVAPQAGGYRPWRDA